MKTIFIFCAIFISLEFDAFSQCGVDQKELREKYCMGTYLVHSILYSTSPNVEIALKEGNNYAIYLFNQTSRVSTFSLTDSRNNDVNLQSRHSEKYSVHTFSPTKSDTFKFNVGFENREGCVLWSIYLQSENHLRQGFYKDFEELKFNNPSGEFKYQVIPGHKKYSGNDLNYYTLSINKNDAKNIGKVLGFSDGENIYMNTKTPSLRPATEFVKAEYMYRYYYFEEAQIIVVANGSSMVSVPMVQKKIMDMNSGNIVILSNRNLREIIGDNSKLLNEFDNDTRKNRNLKDYLKRYLADIYEHTE